MVLSVAAMAEWLRRWTRNPMGFPRAGSNPARSGNFFDTFLLLCNYLVIIKQQKRAQKLLLRTGAGTGENRTLHENIKAKHLKCCLLCSEIR